VSERNNALASKLVKLLDVSNLVERMHPPVAPPVGGDHPVPKGQFVTFLFQPFVWPVDSETGLATDAQTLSDEYKMLESAGEDVRSYALKTIDGGLWVGEGADAARAAYMELASMKFGQADVSRIGSTLFFRAAEDVAMTKRNMYKENTNAHKEIEHFLRSGSGHSTAQVAVILTTYRTIIQDHAAELQTYATAYTTQFTAQFTESGGENGASGPHIKAAGNDSGAGRDASTGPDSTTPPGSDPGIENPGSGFTHPDSTGGTPGATPGSISDGPARSPSTNGFSPRPSTHSPLSTLLGPLTSGGLSSFPGLGSGGGGGLPFSGLQGLMGGFGGFPGGGGGLSSAGFGGGFQAPPALPSLGMSFGQGLAAGASAAGVVPSVPQAPMAPLLAPLESAPGVAAPATAVAAPVAPAATSGVGGGGSEGMTSYGSVLPPAGAPGAGGGVPASSAAAEMGGSSPASTSAGAGGGLMPVSGTRASERVSRKVAESNLEWAKMLVAELAGAAAVTDPGLDWAVAVGHNSSGMPTYWVATNDGATYIPPGVFLRNTMSVSSGLNDVFDARWMGWVNPAEKAVRVACEYGDTVGAVATTWAWQSEYLADHPAVPEVATGVPPSSTADNQAATLGFSRVHRLQTVDAALYADLKAVNEDVLRTYCRELIRQLAFGVAGDDLTPVAQSVAQALVAQRSPKAAEWAALGAEYEIAQALTGAQRPGLNGVENPDQVVSYCREFIRCRRMEALLCWEQFGGDLLNVVYAAWVAEIRAPLKDLQLERLA
jgi:hypothetical protein